MGKFKTGLIHVYTGNGKGKTTAAVGLAVRAAGAGLRICIHQFMKKGSYGETKTLKQIGNIDVKQCGRRCFVRGKPQREDKDCAQKGFAAACRDIFSNKYDMIILDEINVVLSLGLIDTEEFVAVLGKKPSSLELVMTGRHCPAPVLRMAALITEMREIRHPYRQGVKARAGIEY